MTDDERQKIERLIDELLVSFAETTLLVTQLRELVEKHTDNLRIENHQNVRSNPPIPPP